VVYAAAVEPYWIEVTRHQVAAPVDPPHKLAQLTDLHVHRLGRREESMLALLEQEKPDVIVITGDSLIDGDVLVPRKERRSAVAYARTAELLERLRAPLGVWAVRGNWENVRRVHDERAYYQGHGVRLLVNEAQSLRPSV
jgi:predicted MPP superfamily phosphohydrolase